MSDAAWRDGWPVGPPELCQQILVDDPYGRVMVDAGGTISYVNPAFAAMVDRPPEEIVGTIVGRYFTRASLKVGARVMRQLQTTNDGDIPFDLDLERPDGSLVPVEVGGHPYFDHPTHPGLHLRIRPATRERWMERFLTELVSGASLDDCLAHLARASDAAIPGGASAILHGWDGTSFGAVTSPSAADELWAEGRRGLGPEPVTDAGPEVLERSPLPWRRAMATGNGEHGTVDALPADYRDAARRQGYRSCWAFPVMVPPGSTPSAAIVVWRDQGAEPLLGHTRAVTKLGDGVALAIERDHSRRRLIWAATHDPLTDLLNREELMSRLSAALDDEDLPVAVLYLDLDRFKPVNDEYGHRFGDDLLSGVGRRLRGALRTGDDIARVGGDEFVVVCRGVGDVDHAVHVADALLAAIRRPFEVHGATITVGASIGFALAPLHGHRPVELIDAADRGLYAAKRSGRGCARVVPRPRPEPCAG
ncbi:GGDEF domain-containing protein [Iamia sp.]|uniref:GGDEF domain-containing protein n=1 Tax=Iamia sp. TaxID=2722710 RepID=UPI002BCCE3A4|nr:GGDEF domain-containing protein [Iamia sp.]HXH56523.1 GGDEF domain-containing protein [Iamia sp.]